MNITRQYRITVGKTVSLLKYDRTCLLRALQRRGVSRMVALDMLDMVARNRHDACWMAGKGSVVVELV